MAGKTTISKQTDLTADITLKAYNSTGKLSIDKNATLQNGKLEIDTQNVELEYSATLQGVDGNDKLLIVF